MAPMPRLGLDQGMVPSQNSEVNPIETRFLSHVGDSLGCTRLRRLIGVVRSGQTSLSPRSSLCLALSRALLFPRFFWERAYGHEGETPRRPLSGRSAVPESPAEEALGRSSRQIVRSPFRTSARPHLDDHQSVASPRCPIPLWPPLW